jgi:hypothetical protein
MSPAAFADERGKVRKKKQEKKEKKEKKNGD